MGRVTRLMSPCAVCVFSAREATRMPTPAKVSAPATATPKSSGIDPRMGTPNTSAPKPKSTGSSTTRNSARMSTKASRK